MNTKRLTPLLKKELGSLSFAMFLRVARSSLDLTQTQMAKKLGMARGTLCDIEKGRQLVSPSLARKIAKKAKLSEAIAIKSCFQDQLKKAKINMKIEVIAS